MGGLIHQARIQDNRKAYYDRRHMHNHMWIYLPLRLEVWEPRSGGVELVGYQYVRP